jgi:hypothetical protein
MKFWILAVAVAAVLTTACTPPTGPSNIPCAVGYVKVFSDGGSHCERR